MTKGCPGAVNASGGQSTNWAKLNRNTALTRYSAGGMAALTDSPRNNRTHVATHPARFIVAMRSFRKHCVGSQYGPGWENRIPDGAHAGDSVPTPTPRGWATRPSRAG